MIEIHANATPFDGSVYLSSCDKGLPGNLMGLARVNVPSVVVPGGTMNAGPDMLTLEQLGMYSAKYQRGEIDKEKLDWAKCNACPSCGACSFIGTASTMQIMAEALGLALPGSALMPATSPDLSAYARQAGAQAVRLAQMPHMKPSDIITMDSFENAILVHAAISGSTNSLPSPMNSALKLPEILLTSFTEMPAIFWMYALPGAGLRNASTTPAAFPLLWKKLRNTFTWMQ